jgi:hypothetical protein
MLKRMNEAGNRIAERMADMAGAALTIVLAAMFCAGWFLRAGAAGENTQR